MVTCAVIYDVIMAGAFVRWRTFSYDRSRSQQWCKVYYGERGKFRWSQKSSTLPAEKSGFNVVYEDFMTSVEKGGFPKVESETSSLCDVDEFVKMRCRSSLARPPDNNLSDGLSANLSDVTEHDYDVDDEEANLITLDRVDLKIRERKRTNRKAASPRSSTSLQNIRSSIDMLRINDGRAPQYPAWLSPLTK